MVYFPLSLITAARRRGIESTRCLVKGDGISDYAYCNCWKYASYGVEVQTNAKMRKMFNDVKVQRLRGCTELPWCVVQDPGSRYVCCIFWIVILLEDKRPFHIQLSCDREQIMVQHVDIEVCIHVCINEC